MNRVNPRLLKLSDNNNNQIWNITAFIIIFFKFCVFYNDKGDHNRGSPTKKKSSVKSCNIYMRQKVYYFDYVTLITTKKIFSPATLLKNVSHLGILAVELIAKLFDFFLKIKNLTNKIYINCQISE